ncbi:MAG: LicD family protein [Bacteroidales bacterium]|nr:LicD family protein [Bacteroidales bacterium]
MKQEYTPEELARLHKELYDILAEIVRVCDACNIPYFIQGGTAIGAFFEQSILPWDDDIDLGLTRENYNRFIKEAPALLGKDYFLQWPGSEPHTPYYFAKVMKRNTLFVEEDFEHLQMEKGIFVDVFPFDKVPDNQRLQKIHRVVCNFFNCCFMGKEIWMWNHIRKPQIKKPHSNRGFIPCFFNWLVDVTLPKMTIYRILSALQGMFNKRQTTYYNMVLMKRDHISVASIENPQRVPFGNLTVWAPSDLETYLRHHYPRLRRYIPKEEQMNHRPVYLSFDSSEIPTKA